MKTIRLQKKWLYLIGMFVIAIAGVGYWYWQGGVVATDNAAFEARVVAISPKISGYVKRIHMKDNQSVKAGELLLEIDPTEYILRVERAKAGVQAAEAAFASAKHNLEATQVSAPSAAYAAAAQTSGAKALWEKAAADKARTEQLFAAGACSKQQLEQHIAAEKAARSSVEQLEAVYRATNVAEQRISADNDSREQKLAAVQQAKADLAQAESDLANTKIYAPMDGRIAKRSIEMGSYVQVGQQAAALIGEDLWVIANYKETQLAKVRTGQAVDIRIDAYPKIVLKGHVESMQAGTGSFFSLFPAENATGNFVKIVQRVPVKIILDTLPDSEIVVGPGMSVTPQIYTRVSAGRL